MKLSPAERAILINQYRILELLHEHPDTFKNTIDVLSAGYELDYEEHIDGLSEPLAESECKFVQDILWVYYIIKTTKNRTAIDNPGGDRAPDGRLRLENFDPKFPGFDGNNQTRYLSYAKHLLQEGKFVEHNHYLNSHGAQPDYHRVIDLWENWGRPTKLTEQQADELLAIR